MKIKNILAGFIAVMAVSAFGQSANDQEVWNNVAGLNTAVFGTKDSGAIKALLNDRVSYSHSSGVTETKAQVMENASASKTTYRDIAMEKISLVFVNETAIARHLFTATQTDKDGKVSGLRLGILQVWVKQDGRWELYARQAVRLAAI